jgi:hypothetical protein
MMQREFWADEIKRYKDDPRKRLALAWENLPYPAAFRHAAVAIRSLLKGSLADGQDIGPLLDRLYGLAALENFLFDEPALPNGLGPAFNVAEGIPKETLAGLEFPYDEIGYEKLPLLSKSDVKLLVSRWGEPRRHRSARRYRYEDWQRFLGAYERSVPAWMRVP